MLQSIPAYFSRDSEESVSGKKRHERKAAAKGGMDKMEALLEKIESYHIFTSLYLGIMFAILSDGVIHDWIMELQERSLFMALCICYFIGMIINRIGSLFVETGLKKANLIIFAPLEQYIEAASGSRAKNKDLSEFSSKIDILSETNNTYRSLVALFFVIFFYKLSGMLLGDLFDAYTDYVVIVAWLLGGILMIFAYRKQTKYIVERIHDILNR